MTEPGQAVVGRRRVRACDERGSLTIFAVVMVAGVFLLVALLVDGGAIRNARRSAGDLAQEAARAAAQEVVVGDRLSSGEVQLDPRRARTTARSYLEANGIGTANVVVENNRVVVTVQVPVDLLFLSAGGERSVNATRYSNARDGLG